MKKWLLSLVFLGLSAVATSAQVNSGSTFSFDQAGPDLPTVSSYNYKMYADGATTALGIVVTCKGTASPFVCTATFPAFTPGPHAFTLTASNSAGESAKSASFAFTFVVIPTAPANVRLGSS